MKQSTGTVLYKYLIERTGNLDRALGEYEEITLRYKPKAIRAALKDTACNSIPMLRRLCEKYNEKY